MKFSKIKQIVLRSDGTHKVQRFLSQFCVLAACVVLTGGTGGKSPKVSGLQVPEGFTIESAVSETLLSYPMFASFDGSGRLFVFESTEPNVKGTAQMLAEPSYHVRLLQDLDGDGDFEKTSIFAKNIPFPKGGVFYQGSLYVTESPNLTRYTDSDGDGVAEKREVVLTGWNFHSNAAILGGPFLGPDGWLYLTDARRGFDITTKEGVNLKGKTARIWRCRPDGSGLESMAGGGFDNSIEIAFMPSGETIGTMTYFTDPRDGQRDALMHWVEGGVYPKPNSAIDEDGLKLTGDLMPVMTKMPRVAPAGVVRFQGKAFGPGYEGNFFNAEFNTGRIMRHIISPDGATFKTVDSPFMKSTSPDSHPTDVLQDADGSMLVIVTGAWFSDGCPLSRTVQADIKGGIYRIRKTGTPGVKDAWGKKLKINGETPGKLVKYLSDARPFVRSNAVEELVSQGKTSVAFILRELPLIKDADFRANAIFALSRIKNPAAQEGVRNALNDKSSTVRTAASRAIGLAKDSKASQKLMKLVQNDVLSVRRQAATALGQIGDPEAVPALLNAASNTDDRFVRHAIIHSLIMLKSSGELVRALENPSIPVRIAAMTALDQMDGAPLKKGHLTAALSSGDLALKKTGIWVASHHPQWADTVIDFLRKSLSDTKQSESDQALIKDLILTFIKEPELQKLVSAQLGSSAATVAGKLFVLDVMAGSSLKDLPKSWVSELGAALHSQDSEVRSRVIGVIESRRVTSLNDQLDKIAENETGPIDFRLKALSARIMSSPELTDESFRMLIKFMGKTYESPVRQLSVRVLNQASLTDEQLSIIARDQIGKTDLFLLPALLETFEGNKSEKVGRELVTSLQSANGVFENLTEQDLKRVISQYPQSVHTLAEPLIVKLNEKHAARLTNLRNMESTLKGGDVGEGRKLFFGKASCYSCHSVGSEGGQFGPDLTNIGEIRSVHDILEAVVYPSVSFAREYETFRVVTGTTAYIGIIKEQLPESIVIEVGPAPGLRIARSEIKAIEPHTVSMMPPGLDKQLSQPEMANLTAFLQSLPYRLDRMIQARDNNK